MELSAETVLATVTGLGALLSGAVARMWVAFTSELKDCKEDRRGLHVKVDGLHTYIVGVASKLGKVEGLLQEKEDKRKSDDEAE